MTDFATPVKFQTLEDREWHDDDQYIPSQARPPESEVHREGVDTSTFDTCVPFCGKVSKPIHADGWDDSRIATGEHDTACRTVNISWLMVTRLMDM